MMSRILGQALNSCFDASSTVEEIAMDRLSPASNIGFAEAPIGMAKIAAAKTTAPKNRFIALPPFPCILCLFELYYRKIGTILGEH